MAEVSLERQFIGQARLVRLLLWRVGDSTDIDECLRVALESGMLAPDDEAFLRGCLAYEEQHRGEDGAAAATVPEDPDTPDNASHGADAFPIDAQMVARLRRCVDKLNRADAA